MRRSLKSALAGLIVGACAAGGVQAQSCFSMQAEMMQLLSQGQGGGFGGSGRYERAYREQARVIARTEQHARNAGCFGGGFFLFRRDDSRACRTLVPKLRDMQNNLTRLDQLRRQEGSSNTYRLRELRSMMQARGCDMPGRSVKEDATPDQRFLWEDDRFYSARGTYRTLCVRTCDGFYFPISFSTVPDQFTTDEQTCQAMCPGTEAHVYYHPNPGGGPESMVSILGAPYSSLPTAFQYRTSYNPECTCRPQGGYSVAATQMNGQPISVALADPTAPPPRPRPAPGEDPETLANRMGGFVPSAVASDTNTATAAVTIGADGKSVRIVGPVYWGGPQEESPVITPVPN